MLSKDSGWICVGCEPHNKTSCCCGGRNLCLLGEIETLQQSGKVAMKGDAPANTGKASFCEFFASSIARSVLRHCFALAGFYLWLMLLRLCLSFFHLACGRANDGLQLFAVCKVVVVCVLLSDGGCSMLTATQTTTARPAAPKGELQRRQWSRATNLTISRKWKFDLLSLLKRLRVCVYLCSRKLGLENDWSREKRAARSSELQPEILLRCAAP